MRQLTTREVSAFLVNSIFSSFLPSTQIYNVFDVRPGEEMKTSDVKMLSGFEAEALGNSVPVGLVELFMEAILIATGKKDCIEHKTAVTKELRKAQEIKYPRPLNLVRRKTDKANVPYWTWQEK